MMRSEEKKWVEQIFVLKTTKEEMVEKLKEGGQTEDKIKECSEYYDKLQKKEASKPELFERFFNKEKLKKVNRVAVVYLMDNDLADFYEVESRDGEFIVNGEKYHEDKDCIYTTKKDRIPLAVIRQWDMIPLGTKRWYDTEGKDERMREKFAQLERHVLRGIKNFELYKNAANVGVGSISTKQAVLWGIVVFCVGFILKGFF